MYFNNKNRFCHGIMFHHFHDNAKHKKTQGSITAKKFEEIINFIGPKNIINPDEFQNIINKKKRIKNKVCFTFDDAIKCQFDLARPVMDKYNIKAFFFIYTSIFYGKPDLLEIYRYFRVNYYKNINDFYYSFFSEIKYDLKFYFKIYEKEIKEMKIKFPFYSILDIKFRIIRDSYLKDSEYVRIMKKMMKKKGFDYKKFFNKIFLQKKDVKQLHEEGHKIGLHTHTHPTKLENMNYQEQLKEYSDNLYNLNLIIDDPLNKITTMSHPCGSYNLDSLFVLRKLNINLGFKQIMMIEKSKNMKKINNSNLEIARIDHALILRELKKSRKLKNTRKVNK